MTRKCHSYKPLRTLPAILLVNIEESVFLVVLRGLTTLWGVVKFLKKSRRAGTIGLPARLAAAGRDLPT